jgi:hypothetical protein
MLQLCMCSCFRKASHQAGSRSARQDEATPDTIPAHYQAEIAGQSVQVVESTSMESSATLVTEKGFIGLLWEI